MNNEPVAYVNSMCNDYIDWKVDPMSIDGRPLFINSVKELTDQLAKYKQVLESIANEYVELSHDKIKWQNEDHIRWAKEALK